MYIQDNVILDANNNKIVKIMKENEVISYVFVFIFSCLLSMFIA